MPLPLYEGTWHVLMLELCKTLRQELTHRNVSKKLNRGLTPTTFWLTPTALPRFWTWLTWKISVKGIRRHYHHLRGRFGEGRDPVLSSGVPCRQPMSFLKNLVVCRYPPLRIDKSFTKRPTLGFCSSEAPLEQCLNYYELFVAIKPTIKSPKQWFYIIIYHNTKSTKTYWLNMVIPSLYLWYCDKSWSQWIPGEYRVRSTALAEPWLPWSAWSQGIMTPHDRDGHYEENCGDHLSPDLRLEWRLVWGWNGDSLGAQIEKTWSLQARVQIWWRRDACFNSGTSSKPPVPT